MIFDKTTTQYLRPREDGYKLKLITFEILAAERLRLTGFDNQLIIDCFANVVNIHSELEKLQGGALHTI